MEDLKVLEHAINAMKGYAKSNNDRDNKVDERISIEIKNNKTSNDDDTRGISTTEGINDEEMILKVMQGAAMLVRPYQPCHTTRDDAFELW